MDMNHSKEGKVHPTPSIGERRSMKQGLKAKQVELMAEPKVEMSGEGRQAHPVDMRHEESRSKSYEKK